jgi:chromosome segregation ATPase
MPSLEHRIELLELRVDELATWAGPGQSQALTAGLAHTRDQLAKIRRAQELHTRQLRQLAALQADVAALKTEVADVTADVAGLKSGVGELTTEMADLRADVMTLKADVADVKADVATLKADMVDMKGTVAEILRRLPPANDPADAQ